MSFTRGLVLKCYQDCVAYSNDLNTVNVKVSSLKFIQIIFKNLLPTPQKTHSPLPLLFNVKVGVTC
jgi:hypothetical protein